MDTESPLVGFFARKVPCLCMMFSLGSRKCSILITPTLQMRYDVTKTNRLWPISEICVPQTGFFRRFRNCYDRHDFGHDIIS